MLLTVSVAVKQFVSFTMRGPLASQPPCVGLKDLFSMEESEPVSGFQTNKLLSAKLATMLCHYV